MEARPPKMAERIAELLIPPACREQVMGDLAERFTSTPRYLLDVVALVPHLVASRIRRRWNPQLVLIEGFAAFVAYAGAAFLAVVQGETLWGIALAVAITTLGLALAGAYDRGTGRVSIVQPLFASALTIGALSVLDPRHYAVWPVGGLSCAALIYLGRAWLPTGGVVSPVPPPEDLALRVRAFQTRVRRRNLREYVAALVVITAFSAYFARNSSATFRAGCALIVAGALYNMAYLYRKGSIHAQAPSQDLASYYKAELARQRDLLLGVMRWAMLPLLPGLLVFLLSMISTTPAALASAAAGLVVWAFLFACIWSANRHAAFELKQEIDQLD